MFECIEIVIKEKNFIYIIGGVDLEPGTNALLLPCIENIGHLFLQTTGPEVGIPYSGIPIYDTNDIRVKGKFVGDKFRVLFKPKKEV